jgi:putative effector of murein hydrolase
LGGPLLALIQPIEQSIYNRTALMFRSTLIVSLLAALGSVVSFFNQLVLARLFGTGEQMDAYLLSVSIPAIWDSGLPTGTCVATGKKRFRQQ